MSKINKKGQKSVEIKIKKPLETVAQILQEKGQFKYVQPMFEMVFEELRKIDTDWEKTDK
tara:strand:+ start:1097 stop:1276 length:180 start_codon:yes stop_codon:yes gene_type:complete